MKLYLGRQVDKGRNARKLTQKKLRLEKEAPVQEGGRLGPSEVCVSPVLGNYTLQRTARGKTYKKGRMMGRTDEKKKVL